MLSNKKEAAEKQRKTVFAKEIVTKNPIFSTEHIEELFRMFNLYCDNHRQCDVNDILNTARTLGFDKKYQLVYRGLETLNAEVNGEWINFETFLKKLTAILGNPFNADGRFAMFSLINPEGK